MCRAASGLSCVCLCTSSSRPAETAWHTPLRYLLYMEQEHKINVSDIQITHGSADASVACLGRLRSWATKYNRILLDKENTHGATLKLLLMKAAAALWFMRSCCRSARCTQWRTLLTAQFIDFNSCHTKLSRSLTNHCSRRPLQATACLSNSSQRNIKDTFMSHIIFVLLLSKSCRKHLYIWRDVTWIWMTVTLSATEQCLAAQCPLLQRERGASEAV